MARLSGAAFVLLSMVVVAVGGVGGACSTAQTSRSATGPEEQSASTPAVDTLLAQVDTVHAPARIAPSDTLRLRLRGMVGRNGCYSLARIETTRASDRIVFRPVVRHSGAAMCTMAIVSLDETVTVAPPFQADALRIVVQQSDGPAVRTTVRVSSEKGASGR